ncbi:MAG: hypothetical protein LKF41_01575 [Bifidobacterium sp.]|jgi:Leucine-rich repeat (LRR) protein|nr:hypothetical protein [Bifidobacterium sp.]MCH4174531.1 hypothetical protein [Bifidobacterium sp.]
MVGLTFGAMVAPAASAATSDVAVNESNFPDAVFRGYVSEHFDTDTNGSLTADEISNAQSIHVSEYLDDSQKFHSVQGIEYFTELTNLFIPGAYVSELDVSHNPQLVEVNVYKNQLNGLDLSQNPKVETLNISDNPIVALKAANSIANLTTSGWKTASGVFGVEGTFDLATFVSWFDSSKVSDFKAEANAALEGTVITGMTPYDGYNTTYRGVKFNYNAGHGQSIPVSIALIYGTDAKAGEIRTSNPRIIDIGTHTAGLSVDYEISEELWAKVNRACLNMALSRVFEVSVHPGNINGYGFGNYPGLWDCETGGVSDTDTSESASLSRARIYAVRNETESTAGWRPPSVVEGSKWSVTYQQFSRAQTENKTDLPERTGTLTLVITGLLESTSYGNWLFDLAGEQLRGDGTANPNGWSVNANGVHNLWALPDYAFLKLLEGKDSATDLVPLSKANPASYQYAGITLTLNDGTVVKQPISETSLVPEFTTQSVTPLGEGELNDGNKGDIEGENNNSANPDSPYRVYINKLVDSCKALVDEGLYCYWAGYIYSTPTRLLTPDEQNHLLVQKDNNGKYYINVQLPASYSGVHKIALYDQEGNIQGWTNFTIGESAATGKGDLTDKNTSSNDAVAKNSDSTEKQLAFTGSSIQVIILAGVIVLLVGIVVIVVRKVL